MCRICTYESVVLGLQTLALIGVMLRLVSSGLYKTYPFFLTYLAAQTAQAFVPMLAPNGHNLYRQLFLGTESIIVCMYALVVLELYSLVFRQLPGIATVSRRYIRVALGVAILAAILLLQLEQTPTTNLTRFYTFECAIVTSLILFVFLITIFLFYYPIPLNRNVIYYSIGYAVYFTSKALALFLRNTGLEWDRYFSLTMLVVSTSCLVFWAWRISRAGEQKTVVIGHRWSRRDEQHLLEQLESINSSLLRARK